MVTKNQYVVMTTATVILCLFGIEPLRALIFSVFGTFAAIFVIEFITDILARQCPQESCTQSFFLSILFVGLTVATCFI